MTKTLLEKYEAELKEYRQLGHEALEIRSDGKKANAEKMIYILKKHEVALK